MKIMNKGHYQDQNQNQDQIKINMNFLNEKIFYYSILENSRGVLQEYAIKNSEFHLKNSK